MVKAEIERLKKERNAAMLWATVRGALPASMSAICHSLMSREEICSMPSISRSLRKPRKADRQEPYISAVLAASRRSVLI